MTLFLENTVSVTGQGILLLGQACRIRMTNNYGNWMDSHIISGRFNNEQAGAMVRDSATNKEIKSLIGRHLGNLMPTIWVQHTLKQNH